MNKKRICIVCVIMVFGIMAGCFLEEKYENHIPMEPDVVSSISMNQDQYLTIVANRDKIEDKEEFAELLVNMRVYLWKDEIEGNEPVMVVEYKTTGYGEEYDIVHDPEQFDLFIDGNCVNNY